MAKIWTLSFWVRYHVKTITSCDGTFTIMNRKLYSGIHVFLKRKGIFKEYENVMQWKGWKYWARLALIFLSYFPKSKRRKNGEWEGRGEQRQREGRGMFAFIFSLHSGVWQTPLKAGFVYSITSCTGKMIKPLLGQRKMWPSIYVCNPGALCFLSRIVFI